MEVAALPILVLSSATSDKLLEMMEPSNVSLSTTSRVWSPMFIVGVELAYWPRMVVFLRLMVRENSVQERDMNC